MKRIILLVCFIATISLAFKVPSKLIQRKVSIFNISCEFNSGHSGSSCGGIGEWCINGAVWLPCHVPCIGSGSDCKWKVEFSFSTNPQNPEVAENVTMTFQESSPGPYFKMPNRSMETGLGGSQAYINVPEQSIQSSTMTDLLVIPLNNVTLTASPVFSNID